MTSVVSFEPSHAEQIVALWRLLHPDWAWLDNSAARDEIFEPSDTVERIRYVVLNKDAVIASVFSTCLRQKPWPRNRFIQIEAAPADISVEWLDVVFASFNDADRGQADIWHVANLTESSMPILAPLLEAVGFIRHSSMLHMEWSGESVTVVDPSPAHFECYAGGNLDIDQAIVDLHNRSYRPSRLVPPVDLETLWKPRPGQKAREYVLAMENDRLVGYAEWLETHGEPPFISSFVAARSHWGTAVAAAVGTKAMQILVERGHRKIESSVRSNNAGSLRLHREHGWKVAFETSHTFVRRLGQVVGRRSEIADAVKQSRIR
jgi:hypothetical protein